MNHWIITEEDIMREIKRAERLGQPGLAPCKILFESNGIKWKRVVVAMIQSRKIIMYWDPKARVYYMTRLKTELTNMKDLLEEVTA